MQANGSSNATAAAAPGGKASATAVPAGTRQVGQAATTAATKQATNSGNTGADKDLHAACDQLLSGPVAVLSNAVKALPSDFQASTSAFVGCDASYHDAIKHSYARCTYDNTYDAATYRVRKRYSSLSTQIVLQFFATLQGHGCYGGDRQICSIAVKAKPERMARCDKRSGGAYDRGAAMQQRPAQSIRQP